MNEFCSLWWDSNGYTHACLKKEGHVGPHVCCDPEYGGYPGGKRWIGPVYKTAHAVLAARKEHIA